MCVNAQHVRLIARAQCVMSTVKNGAVKNSLLRSLSRSQFLRLLSHSKQVSIKYGQVLCEAGEKIKHIYFINDGLVSLLVPVTGHANTEVGMVGNEGMAGMSLLLGINVSPVRMLVQGKGTAIRMDAAAFRLEIKRNPALLLSLNHYLYVFMAQITQTAACNCYHLIGARLARWLLMTQDRIHRNDFYLTQEFLSHMLGVRRSGVTRAAGVLQKKKLISYSRGTISVLNRKGLEKASCECYRAVNKISGLLPTGK